SRACVGPAQRGASAGSLRDPPCLKVLRAVGWRYPSRADRGRRAPSRAGRGGPGWRDRAGLPSRLCRGRISFQLRCGARGAAEDAAIVSPYPVSLALRDKSVMSRILQAAGVSTPATYVTTHPDKLAPLLEAGPRIVKPYQGTGGYGIRIIRSAVELAEVPHGK